jgi:DNA adenine methylase
MQRIKPLFSYYGGKRRLATRIAAECWKIPHSVYTEPFAGGCAVLFAKGLPAISNSDHYREAINDRDSRIANIYWVARHHPDELERRLQLTPYSQECYREAVQLCKEGSDDRIEMAWAAIVNLEMSFANKMNGGWGTNVCSENRAATWAAKRTSLTFAMKRLDRVYLGNEDALRFIERWDSPQSLHYTDPPYPNTEQGHYSGYTLDDWQALCNLLDDINGSYILSNYFQPIEPKSAQQRIEISVNCSSSGAGMVGKNRDKSRAATAEELGDRSRTEVLWICDRSHKIRKELYAVTQNKHKQLKLL